MSNKDWMTLEEYHKLKDKRVTKKERETHRKWNRSTSEWLFQELGDEQTRPKLERAMDSAIKEENDDDLG